jgi:hypothetical protein
MPAGISGATAADSMHHAMQERLPEQADGSELHLPGRSVTGVQCPCKLGQRLPRLSAYAASCQPSRLGHCIWAAPAGWWLVTLMGTSESAPPAAWSAGGAHPHAGTQARCSMHDHTGGGAGAHLHPRTACHPCCSSCMTGSVLQHHSYCKCRASRCLNHHQAAGSAHPAHVMCPAGWLHLA